MASKIFMRHLADILSKKVANIQAKVVILWYKNDIVSISIKRGQKRVCHIALGFLDQIHVDDTIFDLVEQNSLKAIKTAIYKRLKLLSLDN